MKILKYATFLGLTMLLLISSAKGQDEKIGFKIDSLMSKNYTPKGPGAVILVIKDGKQIFKSAYGKANLELNVSLTTESVLRIGSVTKQFTAISILMLLKEGKLSLDDRITKYYPQLHSDQKITIRHLLNHTSGMKDYAKIQAIRSISNQTVTADELADLFAKEPLEFEPGSQYRYSNSGYMILGGILEKVSGQTFQDFLGEGIFKPLSMNNTCYWDNSTVIPGRASGYFARPNGFINAIFIDNSILFSAGGIFSTVDDLAKWDAALYSDKIVDRKTLALAFTPSILNSGEVTDYGFGFRESQVNAIKSIEHGGGAIGFNSYAIRLESEKVYVIILSNYEGGNKYDELAANVAALAAGKPYQRKLITLEPKAQQKLVGQYNVAKNDTIKISLENQQLFLQRTNGNKMKLVPQSNLEFVVEGTLDDRVSFLEVKRKIESLRFKRRRTMAVTAKRLP